MNIQKFSDMINNEYHETTKKLSNLLKEKDYIIENTINKNDDNILDVYPNDKREKKILSLKYEIMGIYDYNCNLFSWENMMVLTNKKLNNLSKKVKIFKKEIKEFIIKKKFLDIEYMEKILYYISNNAFYIEKENLIDLVKFSLYSVKKDNVLGVLVQDNIINGKKYGIHYFVTGIIST
jgi:hypothetical protein